MHALQHPSIQASAAAGVVVGLLSATGGLPWWIPAAWAALTAVAIAQAVRSSVNDRLER